VRLDAGAGHLLGEPGDVAQPHLDLPRRDERAAPDAALDQAAGGQRVERLADRAAADVPLIAQLALGGKAVADAQVAAADAGREHILDLGPLRNIRLAAHWSRPVPRPRPLRQKDRGEYLPAPCASRS
jgi:hypothetical protein